MPIGEAWRRARSHLWAVLVGFAIGFAIAWPLTLLADTGVSGRAGPISSIADLHAKADWFARVVATGARPFLVDNPSKIQALLTAGPVLLLAAVGLLIRASGDTRDRWSRLLLAAILVPLCVGPFLVLADNTLEFRVLPALSALMLAYVVLAADACIRRVFGRDERAPMAQRVFPAVAIGLAVIGGIVAVRTTRTVIVRPAQQKEAALRAQLQAFDPKRHDRVQFVVPARWPPRDGLGLYSMRSDLEQDWVPRPDVALLLRSRGIDIDYSAIRVTRTPTRPAPEEFVLDGRVVLAATD